MSSATDPLKEARDLLNLEVSGSSAVPDEGRGSWLPGVGMLCVDILLCLYAPLEWRPILNMYVVLLRFVCAYVHVCILCMYVYMYVCV